jgi:catechol 2,3-dioxygenase-like lactoylglutathione lyase family enzyme
MSVARELCFQFVLDDLDWAIHLYRDVFGLDVVDEVQIEGRGRGIFFDVPRVTLELFDVDHGEAIDRAEVGRLVAQRVRVAAKVDDLREASRLVEQAGAEPMAAITDTPWGLLSRRFRGRDGMQLTLFEEPEGPQDGS